MANQTKNDFFLSLNDLAIFMNKPAKKIKEELGIKSHLVSPEQVRSYLTKNKYKYHRKIISFQMLKGGVAKTTTVLNFGIRAAMYGARVLFIDLDQQANLSYSLGVENEQLPVWLDIIEKKSNVEQAVVAIGENIDLIPSGLNNSILDRSLVNSNRNWSMAVRHPIDKIKHRYDLILIDTAPAISAVNTAVTVASNLVLLPVNPDKFSYLGLKKHMEELNHIKVDFELSFDTKILFTKFDSREKASHEFLEKCISEHTDEMLQTYIRTSSEVKNTIREEKHLFSEKSAVKEDYDQLTRELLNF